MPDCYHPLAISRHAEQEAIRKARDPRNTTLVSIRVNNHGKQLMARPCDACMELIREAGIRTIIYSTDNGWSIEYV